MDCLQAARIFNRNDKTRAITWFRFRTLDVDAVIPQVCAAAQFRWYFVDFIVLKVQHRQAFQIDQTRDVNRMNAISVGKQVLQFLQLENRIWYFREPKQIETNQ
jgi:hypothetical protein